MNAPQDLLKGQVAIGSDNSLQWYDGTEWHSQPGMRAFGKSPQDPLDGQLAIGNDKGFYWHSNGEWYGGPGVPVTGNNPPQDAIEGQIAIGTDPIFCWKLGDIWYTFASQPLGTGLLADRSARIFVPGVAGIGDTSLPGYNGIWTFNRPTSQHTVTFDSVNTIPYVVEGRGNPSSGGTVNGDGTTLTLSNVAGDHEAFYAQVYAVVGWLFYFDQYKETFPDYLPGYGYYSTDVLDINTGAPLVFAATWDYDGNRTISVTFVSDDDGTNPWYLAVGSPYAGAVAWPEPTIEQVVGGPFPIGSIQTMTLVLSELPVTVGFNVTLGTIPADLI